MTAWEYFVAPLLEHNPGEILNAFGDDGVLWGLAYLAARILHIALFWVAARGDVALRRPGPLLLLSAIPGALICGIRS